MIKWDGNRIRMQYLQMWLKGYMRNCHIIWDGNIIFNQQHVIQLSNTISDLNGDYMNLAYGCILNDVDRFQILISLIRSLDIIK